MYHDPDPADGHRVLVDRLWPRGLTKDAAAAIDAWAKDAAPSPELRRSFHSGECDFAAFEKAYRQELESADASVFKDLGTAERLTLLYASRDTSQNHAMVLAEFLRERDPGR